MRRSSPAAPPPWDRSARSRRNDGAPRGTLTLGLGDLVAHVERQRERWIDRGAVAPRLLGDAKQRGRSRRGVGNGRRIAGAQASAERGERVAGDDLRRRALPARSERLAIGEERRDERRPAAV